MNASFFMSVGWHLFYSEGPCDIQFLLRLISLQLYSEKEYLKLDDMMTDSLD
jgi:hypothetical protein